MKVVIAPDSFKGSLTAVQVAETMKNAVLQLFPYAEVVAVPLADGGEGTTDVLVSAMGGELVACAVQDPLGREIQAHYGIVKRNGVTTAVVEVAEASGLTLVADSERDALRAFSFGTGQLIADALNRGCRDFLIGIGGSATTDAGKGLLEALGVRFCDKNGCVLPTGGGSLRNLVKIDISKMDRRLADCRFMVACDVKNVLFGEYGAAYVFAPQKGASSSDVKVLDEGLRRFAECVKQDVGVDVDSVKGGGAAGGIGAALVAFLGAKLEKGVHLVMDVVGFDSLVTGADVVLTGEGRMDRQTLMGKLPVGVLERARKQNGQVKVIGVCGAVENREELLKVGFDEILPITPSDMPLRDAMSPKTTTLNLIHTLTTHLSSNV